jgi:septum formation protein
MTALQTVILASTSARRARILHDAGVQALVMAPSLDDSDAPLEPKDPCAFVMGLAWFKARLVLGDIAQSQSKGANLPRWLVAADTMCVQDGRVIGKPVDAQDLRRMLRSFEGRCHDVVTGVCIVDRHSQARHLFFDSAQVQLGTLQEQAVQQYAESREWQGKAGGYNYQDRVDAGWPLTCDGDPETVMGLPSRLVLPVIGVRNANPRGTP